MSTLKYVKWEEVNRYIDSVAAYYKYAKVPGVYGLPRGGLVFATMISHKMNIPMLLAPHPDCIIVDDIADTGESLIHYQLNSSKETRPKYHITTMFAKPRSSVLPELVFTTTDDATWIVFPWEEY